jgi:thiamine pyrophosphate-dependent acetolactate synthase large subunit-like protein
LVKAEFAERKSAESVRVTGGEALARAIGAAGVREVFGVPAGKLTPFMQALEGGVAPLRYTGVRHEAAATWMAAAVFQASGQLAVCFGESGPGSHNLLSALGSAHNNNLAVLVLTPGAPSHVAYPHEGMAMDSDNVRLFAPVTKWGAVARDPARIPDLVRRAVREALTGRPGPVHLEVPADVLAAELDFAELGAEHFMPSGRTYADPTEVERAAELLAAAERPLLIAGGGVSVSDSAAEFRALAERIGAAATATQMGLGCVSTDSPAFFGHGGVVGGEAVVRAMQEADVVLAVGCRFSSWLWCGSGPCVRGWPEQELIQVDIDPTGIGRARPLSVGLQGDAKAVLGQLLEALPGSGAASTDWLGSLVDEYKDYREELSALADAPADVMHPAALAAEIGAALPPDALVAYDGGHTTFWSNDLTPALEPRTRFHEPGMAHLGFGIPYAHALKLLHPERPVLNITGDGAFGFTVQELDTARRLGLAAVHVIHNNSAWGVVGAGQRRAGFQLGIGLEETDYAAIAEGFGCHAERVRRRDEVAPALERALASGLPAVIDARVRFEPHPGLPRFAGAGRR